MSAAATKRSPSLDRPPVLGFAWNGARPTASAPRRHAVPCDARRHVLEGAAAVPLTPGTRPACWIW